MGTKETISLKEHFEKTMEDFKSVILERDERFQTTITELKEIVKTQQSDIDDLQKWRWLTIGGIGVITAAGGLLTNLYTNNIASIKAKEEIKNNIPAIAEEIVTKLENKYDLELK